MLSFLKSVMQPYPFTNERIEELETLLQQRVKQLTEQHVRLSIYKYNNPLTIASPQCTQLLQESGLARIIGLIEVNDETVS